MPKKAKYSGNVRIDTDDFEERDVDTEFTKKMWLTDGDIQEDPDFQRECKEKIEQWKKAISITANPDDIVVHTVGESHIDCAWLWRYEQTREKAYKTFKKACEHADLFPDKFNFALSEPLLLEWVKEDHPDLFAEIQEKVKAGNIELVGGSYVEPDCMMPAGEAFCRMRLYGMRFLREHFGILPKVEWFLDSFGYNWGIPQILTKSGAKYFWTTKITWNYDTIFPFVNFWWEGPDGSRIITCNFQMGPGPLDNWMKWEIGRHPLKADGKKIWTYEDDYENIYKHVEEDEICPHVGNFTGKGDGGHGPTHQEVAVQNEYCKDPMFQWSRVHDFYEGIEKWSDRFPVWNDELYLENHRGTFSVHARVKRYNRKNENALTSHESLALITSLLKEDYQYPFDTFEWGWKTTLKNQFHDTLPGSSIPEVYDDCWEDWMEQEDTYEEIRNNVGKTLGIGENAREEGAAELFLYNPSTWERTSRVFIPISTCSEQPKLDEQGKPPYAKLIKLNSDEETSFICQPIAAEEENTEENMPAGWWVIPTLRPTSITPFELIILNEEEEQSALESISPIKGTDTEISNSMVSVKLDPDTGALLELKNKSVNNGENLLKGEESNFTYAWQDEPNNWPAWNLEHYWERKIEIENDVDVAVKLVENGPVFATLEINKKILDNPITQKVTVMKDCPEVFLQYLTDWKQEKKLLKVKYSTKTDAKYSTADICYSAIKRKTQPEPRCDKARFEKIMHKYCDLSTPDNSWGIAMLNEGKYAFDTEVDNETMRLTMLKAAEYPGPAAEAWVHKERKINKEKYGHEVPEVSGLEPFKCRYALLPHNGGALENPDGTPNMEVKRHAESFNQPILVIPTGGIGSEIKEFQILEIKNDNVFLGTLKLNEWEKNGNIVARFVEGCGIPTEAKVSFRPEMADKIKSIRPIDILERETDTKIEWDVEKRELTFPIEKFEIITIEFEL